MPTEDNDPVIASYDVFISPTPSTQSLTAVEALPPSQNSNPKLYILQYPSHRPSNKPYTSSRSQKPTSFRAKPNAGIFEVDIPLLISDNYNTPLGTQYGRAVHESKAHHPTSGYGLSGGFSQNQASTQAISLDDLAEREMEDSPLVTQTLGGKLAKSTERDPVYMLATLSPSSSSTSTTSSTLASGTIHLRHVDGLVQLRPQLHHIDAQEELKRHAELAAKQATKPDPVASSSSAAVAGPAKLETKAIEMKLKDSSKEDSKMANLNENARLLREIQNEPWRRYRWVEKGEEEFKANPVGRSGTSGGAEHTRLKSALDNDEWLNRMSSPGIELRTRLKGRDRERARRKRQERLRNARAAEAAGQNDCEIEEVDVDETATSDEDEDENLADIGPVPQISRTAAQTQRPRSPEVQIKQEGSGPATAATTQPPAPRRRGRPPKDASAG